jgi:hypothetical protein
MISSFFKKIKIFISSKYFFFIGNRKFYPKE